MKKLVLNLKIPLNSTTMLTPRTREMLNSSASGSDTVSQSQSPKFEENKEQIRQQTRKKKMLQDRLLNTFRMKLSMKDGKEV